MASKVVVPETEVVKCRGCGKTLSSAEAIKAGVGGLCAQHDANGLDAQALQAHRLSMTVNTAPDGFIKLAVLDKLVKAKRATMPGLTITRMVNAIGKDRGLVPPLHEIARPVYLPNGHRWVNGWLATKPGLEAIRTGDFSKAPTK